ncbi:MAG: RHS repeat-associated core domain-containing protein [Thermodesulfobacteriota bacterium]|nr:RHS repeat-associated core domain-containing protein [Thermodesulfobacteriota bacterium]
MKKKTWFDLTRKPRKALVVCILFLATSITPPAVRDAAPFISPSPADAFMWPLVGVALLYNVGFGSMVTLSILDPVSAGGGEFRFKEQLLSLGGLIPLEFTLMYAPDLQFNKTPANSGRTQFPPHDLIQAFTSNTVTRLLAFDDRCEFESYVNVLLNGDTLVFKDDGTGNYQATGPEEYLIQEVGDYYYMMDPNRGLVYIFRSRTVDSWASQCQFNTAEGEVIYIFDRNNNRLSYTYDNTLNLPTKIEDGLGRSLDFTHAFSISLAGRNLSSVSDGYGRTVGFTYGKCGSNDVLSSFTDPMGRTTTFEYDETKRDCTLIEKLNRPLNNSHIDQTWTENPRGLDAIGSQKDAYGNETTLGFSQDGNGNVITTVTDSSGGQRRFRHQRDRYPLESTDPSENESSAGYNTKDQMTSIKDRLGDTTSYSYHGISGKIASITNNKGDTLGLTHTATTQTFTNPDTSDTVDFTFYDLTRVDYPDGTNEQFTYDSNGNPVSRIDQAGYTWTYTYNGRGQVLTMTNPASGVTTYTYNTDATPATSTDSDTGTTTYGYDAYKRLTGITRPDGKTAQLAYDLNDRITSVTDENGNTHTYTYDANGNRIKVTDPVGNETLYAYDLMDRLIQVTDRLGKTSAFAYDSMGRDASSTDPNGIQTTYGYNPLGWLTGVTRAGGTWRIAYDNEGVESSRTSPSGYRTTYYTDVLGRTSGFTNPLNQITLITRDSMGRATGLTDPLNRSIQFSYDGRGLISGASVPVIGSTSYTRNALGLVTQATDPNGGNWFFDYTGMGHLQSSTDPLGNTLQYVYDLRGRISQTTYPDASTKVMTYDDAGNMTRSLFSDGLDLQYTYDALDQLVSANGLTLTRDKEGRVTNSDNPGMNFGATYDDGGRLSTVTYANNAFTVTYGYDTTTGLLSSVTDSLTGALMTFTYDSDRRLVGVYRSNNVHGTLTWDNASRLTGIQEGSIFSIQRTMDAAGQVTQASMTVPLSPSAHLGSGTEAFKYDAACQLSGSGYGYDQQGRLTSGSGHTYTWDTASRLTGIDGVTLTYNGLGALVTRSEGGSTVHFYYNHGIGMKPIVAEQDEASGQFLRYYVWTPSGELLYMIDAANGNMVHFYHFDSIGSTLALTDAAGAVTDFYAYDPYGRLLQHNGSSLQPFTFVGKWGVRQEGSTGGLYHMRARYYDSEAGRFISRDAVKDISPRSINPYQYALRNPLSYTDPTGLKEFGGGFGRIRDVRPGGVCGRSITDLSGRQRTKRTVSGFTGYRRAVLKMARFQQLLIYYSYMRAVLATGTQTYSSTNAGDSDPSSPSQTKIALGGTKTFCRPCVESQELTTGVNNKQQNQTVSVKRSAGSQIAKKREFLRKVHDLQGNALLSDCLYVDGSDPCAPMVYLPIALKP